MQLEKFDLGKAVPETPLETNLEKTFTRMIQQLCQILNKGLIFDDNFDAYRTTITTSATPGTQTAISHGLKRTPIGFLVIEKDKAANLYLGGSGKSASVYNVASDVASVTATIIIF